MKTYRIAVCQFPGGGSQRMETNAYVVRLVRAMDKDPRISDVVSLTFSDTPITHLRNRAVLDARQAKCDYILMIDSDMSPDTPYAGSRPFWDVAWEFMMQRYQSEMSAFNRLDFPPATIAAPYCGPPPEECCYVFQWAANESDTPNPNFRLEMIPREYAAIKAGIEEVAALPTGLILYDMRVFDVMESHGAIPFFDYEWGDKYESIKSTTEDVYQTRNASLLGLPQYCTWSSWAMHVKTKHVGKPMIVTRDQVHASLREAVLRGVDSADRMMILPGPEDNRRVHATIPSSDDDRRI